jgi:predicted O-methyltransferase YrrM
MMAAMNPPTTDPAVIYRTRDAIAAADALAAAIVHLDLFTGLARAPADVAEVCRRHGLHPRPTDVLCTLLSAQGLIARDASGRFEPTATAREFLVDAAPFDARSYYAAMADKPGVADFLQVLRTGRPANWPGAEGEADWHASMRTEAFAEAFTAAMDCRGRVLAPALANAVDGGAARRLLDVGGGSGVYSIAMAERFPTLAATVLEAAPVDAIARRTIRAAGLEGRVAVVAADMFTTPWPAGHDLHLFSNVLHDWDEADCRRLLAMSVAALPAGGRLLIHDMLLDDDKAGPLWAAEYSVLLSTVTQGRLYSTAEIAGWLAELGFEIVARAATALGRSVLTGSRRGHARKPQDSAAHGEDVPSAPA